MVKRFLLLAFAVSTAFSNAFAADPECTVSLSGSTVFTGNQIKPTVTRVVCGDDEYTEFSASQLTYGKNIDVGKESGSVTISLPNDVKVTKTFEIKKKSIYVKTDNCEKEKGAEDPDFSWSIVGSEKIDIDTLKTIYKMDSLKYLADILKINADTLSNLQTVLADNIKLKRVEGEEIANSSGDVIKYYITFADEVANNLNKLLPNYRIGMDEDPGYLIITKTKITVTAKDTSKVYGSADPKFETVITGNIKASEYKKLGTITLTRNKSAAADGNNVGEYEIVVSVPKDTTDDYIIETKSGKFTITPAAVSVKVDNVTKTYGSATPEFTYKATGLVGKDVLSDVMLSCAECSEDGLENVGKYVISANVKASSNPNYKVTVTDNGTLTVTQKAVTVTVKDTVKTYGDKDPKFTYDAVGLVEGGAALKSETITRAEGEKVGTYKVDVAFEDGANPNYKLTLKSGTLKITQKAVTLTADNVTKLFGEEDPKLTYTVDGLATFDGVKDTLAGVTLVRAKGEDAGEYAITATVNAKSNPNYVVTVAEGGTLTIAPNDGKIIVTVKGHVDTVKYDGKEHRVTGYDILSNSTAYPLKFVKFTGIDTVLGTNADSYAMGLSAKNFENTSVNYPNVEFEVTDGSLTILPKSLVITAVSDSITYGDATPTEFKWVADSLLKGDELDNIHVGLSKTGLLPAGEYALDFDKKSPTNKNYVVTEYVPAVLKVGKKLVTVTVGDTSKVYGTPDPETYSVTVTGLIEGDKLAAYTVGREPGEDVLRDSEGNDSTYRISVAFASTEGDPNYILKVKQGHFSITPYTEKISVSIIGDKVCREFISNDSLITVPRSFDIVALYFGDNPLPDSLFYRREFVSYTGVPTVSGSRVYLYPMNFRAEDFVNISPNFTNISFKLNGDGTFFIKKTCEEAPPTIIAPVKVATKFGLSAIGRNVRISGSTVGKKFAILDMQGKVIRSGVVNSENFEVPVANAGIYMVRVGSVTQRIRIK
ncbi:MAG: hypothetical protein IJ905_12005 [Fibrobacter sp.]|nr:hypothetical protein [Fibrobacter sp.]